jgi:hypothetical protein
MTIKNIKIFGERNSGTNYLEQLLDKNIQEVDIFSSYYKGGSGWKHGFPKKELFSDPNKVLFIFIIRDFDSWIKSMFTNPYHYKKPNNIYEFLTNKLVIDENRKDHDVNVYENEKQNIIDLRYSKIESYLNFYINANNAIIINLNYLQDNYKNFIIFLNEKYKIKIIDNIQPIINHTKDEKNNNCNREYNLDIPRNINKNIVIEEFVNNLHLNYSKQVIV